MARSANNEALARAALLRWRDDPIAFAWDVFGVDLWEGQRRIAKSIVDSSRVAVSSGHKIGKSKLCAIIALWWAVTRHRGIVIMLSPSHRQCQGILFREVCELHKSARFPLGGTVFGNVDRGICWSDGSRIFGFATNETERLAGFSGAILYVIDEAAGVPTRIFDVCSTAPGGKVVAISNPTRTSGSFYDCFTSKANVWTTHIISSEEAAAHNPWLPGVKRWKYPHLANKVWIAERAAEYGESSVYYDVRIRGQFSKQSDRNVIPRAFIEAALERWRAPRREDGELVIAVDAARFGTDSSVIAWRRGPIVAPLIELKGSDAVEVAGAIRRIVDANAYPTDTVSIRTDSTNGIGSGIADILRHCGDSRLQVTDIMAQSKPKDSQFAIMRDALWFHCREWLRLEGAIPGDAQLIADLAAPEFDYDSRAKVCVESKKDVRKRIGRSTDRGDAIALCCWSDADSSWSIDDIIIG